ncbi:MAG TPA: ATP-binding cassette domain-containing protein, partial [Stackebrandtia sp.]|uniref:amino acid ABC transporter ATP-binding/permease protein n=1 Tax=Stackebrandtia sp. TaxID=2023065 RepID=UPI002D57E908
LIEGARDLAAYGATASALHRARGHAESLAQAERRGSGITAATTASTTAIAGLTVIGVSLSAAGLGVMTAVLALTALVTFEALTPLPAAARLLVDVRASAARLTELLDAEPPVRDPEDPKPLRDNHYHLRLRSAAPRIPGRELADGVDLDLPCGRRVAIVGASGAGKSMLLSMLVRLCGVGRGTVELGGVDLESLRGNDVRGVIGGMMSDAHLFCTSIRDNLLVGDPNADDDALNDALRRAGLTELDLSTMVGTDGDRLSGGQRQRLLLARALLADVPILLLDEPTEHLDPDTADAIMSDILTATTGRSLILVTHRLAGLDAVDEILVLDEGAVIQRGTHAELSQTPGPYRDLCDADAFASTTPV